VGPATSSAQQRATEEVKDRWLHEEVDLAGVARSALSAALADPDDRLAAAVEDAVDTHDRDHDADCLLGECVLAALRAVALGRCPICGEGGDPRCPRCGSDQ
jgi:hypothetical protein